MTPQTISRHKRPWWRDHLGDPRITRTFGRKPGRRLGGGKDGQIFHMANGHVLKLTISADEAEAVARILYIQQSETPHPAMPRFHDMVRLSGVVTAFTRDDMQDFMLGSLDWENALQWVDMAMAYWPNDQAGFAHRIEMARRFTCRGTPQAEALESVISCMVWLKDHDIIVGDVIPENFGVLPNGSVGLRDFGDCQVLGQDRSATPDERPNCIAR